MIKLNVTDFVNNVKSVAARHSPEILMGFGIAGMITTTVLAVQATPKAIQICEVLKDEYVEEFDEEPTKFDYVKATWKCYVPSAVICAASIACLVGSSKISMGRNAALATAYKLSETALNEYKTKVIETIGERKEQDMRNKIDADRVYKNPVSQREVIITGKGHTLCYDALSGRYFESDIDHIKRAENDLNHRLLREMYLSLNEFYDILGLAHTTVGDNLGWKTEDGLIEIEFSSQIADDGRPCIVIDYSIVPKYGYDKLA